MIKANCENGEIELTLKGDVVELIADVSIILHAVYTELSKENFFAGVTMESKFRNDKFLDIIFSESEGVLNERSNLDES